MRKFLVGALLVAGAGGGVVLSGVAVSGASPTCYTSGSPTPVAAGAPLGTITVNPGSPGSTGGTLQVCSTGSSVINGTATASGNANPPDGYVVANGDSVQNTNGPKGYIGVEGSGSGVAVVGCSTGDYNSSSSSNTPSSSNDDNYSTTNPAPNDGTADSNGNNVIVDSSGAGSITNPPSLVTGQNCGLQNQPQP